MFSVHVTTIVLRLQGKNCGFEKILRTKLNRSKTFGQYNLQPSLAICTERCFYINAYMKLKKFYQSLNMQVISILTIKLQMRYVRQNFGENKI